MPIEVHGVEDLFPYIECVLREEGTDPTGEGERRNQAPDLYDCAVAIGELDRPELVAELLTRGTFGVDDPPPRSQQPLPFLSISRSRGASFRQLIEAGPFQRTRGTVVEVLDSGSVRASLSVFGREIVMDRAPMDVAAFS